MHPEPENQPPPGRSCSCPEPLPRERAVRKGAARTICERCGLPIPLRLRAA